LIIENDPSKLKKYMDMAEAENKEYNENIVDVY
jgi:hypothetical protein